MAAADEAVAEGTTGDTAGAQGSAAEAEGVPHAVSASTTTGQGWEPGQVRTTLTTFASLVCFPTYTSLLNLSLDMKTAFVFVVASGKIPVCEPVQGFTAAEVTDFFVGMAFQATSLLGVTLMLVFFPPPHFRGTT